MNRTQYLEITKSAFMLHAVDSSDFSNYFEPLDGVFKIIEMIFDESTSHPKYSEVSFIVKAKAIWKKSLEDDFLEEHTNWFDFTGLIKIGKN